MSPTTNDKPRNEHRDARSLYHKRREHGGRERAGGSARERTTGKVWQTVRALVIAVVLMGGLLYAARETVYKSWQKKTQAARTRSEPAHKERTIPGPSSAEPSAADELESLPGHGDRSDLDAEAIRSAFYLAERGQELEAKSDYLGAVEKYRSALATWPLLPEVWGQLGRAQIKLGNYREAERALRRASEQAPGDAALLNDAGVCLMLQARYEKAFALLGDALDLDADYDRAHYNRGLCYSAMNDIKHARTSFDEYLKRHPGDARALRELAYLDAAGGDYGAALEKLNTAIENQDDWALLYLDAAAAAALEGKHDESLAYLRGAEDLTVAALIRQFYREPAFKALRATEAGKAMDAELAERARSRVQQAPAGLVRGASEPLLSTER